MRSGLILCGVVCAYDVQGRNNNKPVLAIERLQGALISQPGSAKPDINPLVLIP